jgi:hypothetical protein
VTCCRIVPSSSPESVHVNRRPIRRPSDQWPLLSSTIESNQSTPRPLAPPVHLTQTESTETLDSTNDARRWAIDAGRRTSREERVTSPPRDLRGRMRREEDGIPPTAQHNTTRRTRGALTEQVSRRIASRRAHRRELHGDVEDHTHVTTLSDAAAACDVVVPRSVRVWMVSERAACAASWHTFVGRRSLLLSSCVAIDCVPPFVVPSAIDRPIRRDNHRCARNHHHILSSPRPSSLRQFVTSGQVCQAASLVSSRCRSSPSCHHRTHLS